MRLGCYSTMRTASSRLAGRERGLVLGEAGLALVERLQHRDARRRGRGRRGAVASWTRLRTVQSLKRLSNQMSSFSWSPVIAQRTDPLDGDVDVGELARERGQGLVRVLQDRGRLVHALVLHVVGQHPAAAEGVPGGPVLRAAQHVDRHAQPLLGLEAGVAGLRDLDLLGAGGGQPCR